MIEAMTMKRNGMAEVWVAIALVTAILIFALALFGRPARGDGMRGPPGPPPQAMRGPAPPPSSCTLTAIQLAYQTGRRDLAYLGAEACIAAGERGVTLPYGYYGPFVPPQYFPPGWVIPY